MLCGVVTAGLVAMVTAPRHGRMAIPISPPQPVPVAVTAPAAPVIAPRDRPKPARFPSPQPLTREERAWLALSDAGVVADLMPDKIEPIQIEELTIPPIRIDGGN